MRTNVLLNVATFFLAAVAGAQVPTIEREALIALYDSTAGSNWVNNTGWLGDVGTECSWAGVTCAAGTNVTTLRLIYNRLIGSIPRELGNLSNLERLNLPYNQLSGNIPPALGNLSNLQWLVLLSNQLSGSIPPMLGNLSNLERLYLDNNQLSGRIPSMLGNLSALQFLVLNNNQLGGLIPVELMNLFRLMRLDICDNFLSTDNRILQNWLDLLQPIWDECQGIAVILVDGFESGDTSAWSAATW